MDPLTRLEKLADRLKGTVCLRRYGWRTLLCDTIPGKKEGYLLSGPYVRVGDPLWAVTASRGQLLGLGKTARQAIAQACRRKKK